jgi:glycosyltransferase involved in cell wall biosynthesis
MTFPKVLIIGHFPNEKDGGGITLSNLFRGWPKDRLAVASNIYLKNEIEPSVCEIYYQLGYHGKQHPFPLNILHPKIQCGIILVNKSIKDNKKNYKVRKIINFNKVHTFIDSFLKFCGVFNFFYKLEITNEFRQWLNDYSPDVIYSQLSTLELIRFVNKVQLATNKPLVIHIMDDWPSKITQPGLFSSYWKRRIDKEFRNLLYKSSALMSICEAMSEEYKERYHKDFVPFHNPIEINNWLPFARTQWKAEEKFTILYAGRVGRGMKNSIVEMGIVVNELHQSGINVVFEIQSPDYDKLANLLEANDCIKFVNPIDYSELPKKFSSVDLLFLPEDFDTDSVEFLKFSIQTKVAEYMISGTPILVFADKKTALAKYALQDNWALVVTENKRSALTKALNELINNQDLRRQLSAKAKETAIKNEDAEIVRTNFREVLLQL